MGVSAPPLLETSPFSIPLSGAPSSPCDNFHFLCSANWSLLWPLPASSCCCLRPLSHSVGICRLVPFKTLFHVLEEEFGDGVEINASARSFFFRKWRTILNEHLKTVFSMFLRFFLSIELPGVTLVNKRIQVSGAQSYNTSSGPCLVGSPP